MLALWLFPFSLPLPFPTQSLSILVLNALYLMLPFPIPFLPDRSNRQRTFPPRYCVPFMDPGSITFGFLACLFQLLEYQQREPLLVAPMSGKIGVVLARHLLAATVLDRWLWIGLSPLSLLSLLCFFPFVLPTGWPRFGLSRSINAAACAFW